MSALSQGVASSSDALQHENVTCTFDQGISGNVDIHPAKIKTMSSILEKLLEYAADGAQWPLSANILDPVRTFIICNRVEPNLEVARWFTKYEGEAGLCLCRIKNKLSAGWRLL